MQTIVFVICFGIVSVCLGDGGTTEDGNSWPSICLEDIGNSSCTGDGLTNLKWRFNNLKKDCHPDLICPESKNRFESERECKNACLLVVLKCCRLAQGNKKIAKERRRSGHGIMMVKRVPGISIAVAPCSTLPVRNNAKHFA
uniref:Putative secreted protein n=1 Tax=Ixodes ricinus TaxID=34613 RepID=V5H5R1_IXORI